MNFWRICWLFVKMLYQLLWGSLAVLSILFNIFWFLCNLASAGIPWLTLMLVCICITSKFIKLRSPDEKLLLSLLSGSIEDLSYWPIAHRGAGYDAPENSKAALKKCAARGYNNCLLDAGLTSCGQIVILHRKTLEQAGLSGSIAKYSLSELRKINITSIHPMGSHFETEYVYTLNELLELLQHNQLTIFLKLSDNNTLMLQKLKQFIENNAQFARRTIIVSCSPIAIYQLRKTHPHIMCGLWTEKSLSLPLLKASTLFTSIYGAIFRNIIAPVIGIAVVFLNKDEFNLHIAELWRNVGVRPIVYTVNSPNEKRYFQKTMKTQYLTDSLRSEPHMLIKA